MKIDHTLTLLFEDVDDGAAHDLIMNIIYDLRSHETLTGRVMTSPEQGTFAIHVTERLDTGESDD